MARYNRGDDRSRDRRGYGYGYAPDREGPYESDIYAGFEDYVSGSYDPGYRAHGMDTDDDPTRDAYGWVRGHGGGPGDDGDADVDRPYDPDGYSRRYESYARRRGPRSRVYEEERYRRGSTRPFTEPWSVPGPHTGRGPQGYQRSEERIREEVCERLTRHGQIDASHVEVKVEHGEVTLEGTVDSRRTKRLAEQVAESVSGIRDIHNRLRIEGSGRSA